MGHKGNNFKFIIDTGSGCTLLNDNRCQSSNCRARKAYDKSASPTCETLDRQFKIRYAQGLVIIEIVRDYFFFGEKKVKQDFGLIVHEEKIFEKSSFDGILGLSYPELAQSTKPFFDNLIDSGVLEQNVFSIYLGRKHLTQKERNKDDEMEISNEAAQTHPGSKYFFIIQNIWKIHKNFIRKRFKFLEYFIFYNGFKKNY